MTHAFTPLHPASAQLLGHLIDAAKTQPGNRLDIKADSGAVVATLQAHDLPVRPQDMPRHLRPKARLSRRQQARARAGRRR